jgi:coenzyme F420-reducing hydrogenase beta subunit
VGVSSVADACAFLGDGMSRLEKLEPAVHGRGREYEQGDLAEAHFGVHESIKLAAGVGIEGAQWTGVATGVALELLESGAVDAAVVASSSGEAFGGPEPLLCRSGEEILRGRRVKPSLCPSLAVLDQVAADPAITRLLFTGVGCAVQALRAMNGGDPEKALGLEKGGLLVLGTHCVDNSPSPEAARRFVASIPGVGEERAADVTAYEFMADFRVHARVKVEGGGEETVKQA